MPVELLQPLYNGSQERKAKDAAKPRSNPLLTEEEERQLEELMSSEGSSSEDDDSADGNPTESEVKPTATH